MKRGLTFILNVTQTWKKYKKFKRFRPYTIASYSYKYESKNIESKMQLTITS